MSSHFQDLDPAGVSPEDRINALRGYKATLNNPRVSDEAKQHARDMIDQLGGDQPRAEMKQFDQDHDPTRVAAGYKAAMNNPNVTSQGKQHAQKELNRMSGPSE